MNKEQTIDSIGRIDDYMIETVEKLRQNGAEIISQNHRLSRWLEKALEGHDTGGATRAQKGPPIAEHLQAAALIGRLFFICSLLSAHP